MVSGVASVCSRAAIVTPSPKTSPSRCTRSPNRLLKTLRSPFDKLRANGAGVAIVGDLPFVLSLSKHENDFFSTLLNPLVLIPASSPYPWFMVMSYAYLPIVDRRSLPVVACGLSSGFIPVDRRRRCDAHCGRDL